MKLDSVKLSQDLIRIASYSGVNLEVLDSLGTHLKNLGFDCDFLEFDGSNSYQVNNLHAVLNPKNCARALYFAGHTDVVREGERSAWTHDPFAAEIFDGKLFGRGAADMKCAIACFVSAVAEFLEKNPNPDFGIGFLITNDEEADGVNGTKKVLEWMQKSGKKISHCLVGEPTNPQRFGEMIKVGRRGSIGFKLKITGKQGHVAYPENALNPITILLNLLKILKDHKLDEGTSFFDPSNLEITAITSQNLGANVIPNAAEAEFNVRFNDTHSSKSIIELVEYVCKKTVGLGAKYELAYKTSGESFLSDPKFLAPLVVASVEKVTGKKPVLSTSGGTSDARFIKDYAEVVEIGLVNKTAHRIDEFSEILEIEQLQKTYLEILRSF
ncbi:MAG: succinyl-diaminopimelate desuccinylase [Alphaproteobacteria bacterium]|nr:succinyl-diaminopimelate desuccinylase [Alphaproteobacteria bacterium]